jgi:magnesium chelatase family protein
MPIWLMSREARQRSARRAAGAPWRLNAEIPGSELRRRVRPIEGSLAPLERAMDIGQVSAREADRIIRMSWTLADLAGHPRPGRAEVSAGLGMWLGRRAVTRHRWSFPAKPGDQAAASVLVGSP